MATLERPKLRAVSARRADHQGQAVVAIDDPLGVAEPIAFPVDGLVHWVVRHFDGRSSLADIQSRVLKDTGHLVSTVEMEDLVGRLDKAMLLDGPSFAAHRAAYREQGVRPAACAGRSYAGTERALRAQLGHFFIDAAGGGSGLPGERIEGAATRLRGILSPHIDFQRGGAVYTWSYKELVERSDAQTFVILGVAHQPCAQRFALTRKDFETPLGLARTDRAFVDRLAALAGGHLFDDELAHREEHSVEFQIVFLQYLLEGRRDFSVVPILVGSFQDLMEQGVDPIDDPEVRRFVDALKAAESACEGPVAYIGGIDLGHVGPEFGDTETVSDATLEGLRRFDHSMLTRASAGDPAGWFAEAAGVGNRWRVCGLAATYTMLHAMGPARGTLLRYDQAVSPDRSCCVSFASLAFQTPETEPPADA